MRIIFNKSFEPLQVVWEHKFQELLEKGLVNADQVLIA